MKFFLVAEQQSSFAKISWILSHFLLLKRYFFIMKLNYFCTYVSLVIKSWRNQNGFGCITHSFSIPKGSFFITFFAAWNFKVSNIGVFRKCFSICSLVSHQSINEEPWVCFESFFKTSFWEKPGKNDLLSTFLDKFQYYTMGDIYIRTTHILHRQRKQTSNDYQLNLGYIHNVFHLLSLRKKVLIVTVSAISNIFRVASQTLFLSLTQSFSS